MDAMKGTSRCLFSSSSFLDVTFAIFLAKQWLRQEWEGGEGGEEEEIDEEEEKGGLDGRDERWLRWWLSLSSVVGEFASIYASPLLDLHCLDGFLPRLWCYIP